MWRIFCSSLWEGSIWSEWFVTHFLQLRNEMLQWAVNFNMFFSAKQIIAVNFWEGLLQMGFKRTCHLMQSRSLMLLFLLSWFYIPFNHVVLSYREEKKHHLWKHLKLAVFVVHHLLDGVSLALSFSLFVLPPLPACVLIEQGLSVYVQHLTPVEGAWEEDE